MFLVFFSSHLRKMFGGLLLTVIFPRTHDPSFCQDSPFKLSNKTISTLECFWAYIIGFNVRYDKLSGIIIQGFAAPGCRSSVVFVPSTRV